MGQLLGASASPPDRHFATLWRDEMPIKQRHGASPKVPNVPSPARDSSAGGDSVPVELNSV